MADARRLAELGMVPALAKEVAAQINSGVSDKRRLVELTMVGPLAQELASQINSGIALPGRLAEVGMVPTLAAEVVAQIKGGGWVSVDDTGTKALFDADFVNNRYWYSGVEYRSLAEFKAAISGNGTLVQNANGIRVTGAADALVSSPSGVPWAGWNASAGTLIVEANLATFGASKTLMTLGDGTSSNRIQILVNAAQTVRTDIQSGGVAQFSLPPTPTLAAGRLKVGLAIAALKRNVAINGLIFNDASLVMPSGISTAFYGVVNSAGSNPLNDEVSRVTYFPRVISETRLEQLTTDPAEAFVPVSGAFTFPANFFGVHTKTPAMVALLGAAGGKTLRLRDTGTRWNQMMPKGLSGVSFTAGSTNTVNWTAHGLTGAVHGVWFSNTGGSLPTGIVASQFYYIVNVTADTFQISAAPGGAPISLGNVGSGVTIVSGCELARIDPRSDTGTLDLLVAAAVAAGMDIVFDCTGTPTWLSNDGFTTSRPLAQNYVLRFLDFIKFHYGDAINYWETWNEPNSAGYFTGTTTGANNDLYVYAQYLFDSIAFRGFPWKVMSPSWNINSGAALMGTWLGTDGGKNKIDIVAFHHYRGDTYLTYDDVALDNYVAQAATNAPGKEIWCSEVGDSLPRIEDLWRSHLYAAAKGVKRMMWYSYDLAPGIGEMRLTQYPGLADAYRSMITQCAGAAIGQVSKARSGRVSAVINGASVLY